MELDLLSLYTRKFSQLKRATYEGKKAPHKPILLLSVLDSIEAGEIFENRICITSDLVARFKDNWHRLVQSESFVSKFYLPFYHLHSERFWHLKTLVGREVLLTTSHSIKSFSHLKQVVDYAYFDIDLFKLLLQSSSRNILKQTLLSTYFKQYSLAVPYQLGLVAEIKNEILNEDSAVSKTKINAIDEEEVFVRGGVFKKVVPQIYNHSCCISGMRIVAAREVQMIDACHIIPFSESHDDTISNGISLCPNLHRAFDRGLITIDEEYRVVVSTCFSESSFYYSIKRYEGKYLLMPEHQKYFPSIKNLQWHNENVFAE